MLDAGPKIGLEIVAIHPNSGGNRFGVAPRKFFEGQPA
jgi:hypothetical protein